MKFDDLILFISLYTLILFYFKLSLFNTLKHLKTLKLLLPHVSDLNTLPLNLSLFHNKNKLNLL